MWKRSFRAKLPSKTQLWRCETEAFLGDIPQKLKVEVVKTKLSCEASLKKRKLEMWEWSSRVRLPSKTESWSYWKRSFRGRFPSKIESWNCCDNHCCDTRYSLLWQSLLWHSLLCCRHCQQLVAVTTTALTFIAGQESRGSKKILLGTKNTPRESKIKYYWDQKTCWPASTPKPTPPTKFNFP